MPKVNTLRSQFPILNQREALAYLDNASTTHKPFEVIQSIGDYYLKGNANIHRGSYGLARKAEQAVAAVRTQVRDFIHASDTEEVIFTSGTTESLNMVAQAYGHAALKEGDEVIVSVMEHHSNFLPWQRLCREKKAYLRVVSLTPTGHVDFEHLRTMVSSRTKIIAINYVSHVLGTINPIANICALAHEQGAIVVVDAAQAAAHLSIDVEALGCDFIAFSGHKLYGPTGIGILYGKKKLLASMSPYNVGGGMVHGFTTQQAPIYESPPHRFEAGTLNLAGIIGLGAALRFITQVGYAWIQDHEEELMAYLQQEARQLPLRWVGGVLGEIGIATFNLEGIHPLDVGLRLDAAGIAVRVGSLCAQPLMDYFGVSGGIRVSLGVYNTKKEIDHLIQVLAWVARKQS